MNLNALACNTCPHRSPPPYSGRMDCLYDKAKPVDTQERLRARFCPAGKFPASDEEIQILIEKDRREGPCCE